MSTIELIIFTLIGTVLSVIPRSQCPDAVRYGSGPPFSCTMPSDPNNLPPSPLEKWFTKEMFEDLFPFANLGWGPNPCSPYSYEAFVIAARYFPQFGTSSSNTIYNETENTRRDLAAFFAHAGQETGENNAGLYNGNRSIEDAADCFYRGGFYNWFEGGPVGSFLDKTSPGYDPSDGDKCNAAGRYCVESAEINYFYPCSQNRTADYYEGCYFGRGPIQISYNYNYGQFMDFLKSKNISVNLLNEPNLIITKTDPPLAILASLWFYMTPQPPKPAMHDIVMGTWNSGEKNAAAGYTGPIFGPTSLIINNECNGEDEQEPGDMPAKFDAMRYNYSYQPDWSTTWKEQPCDCAPAAYGGIVPYFDPAYYPEEFVAMNEKNRLRCVASIYANPSMYALTNATSPCLNF